MIYVDDGYLRGGMRYRRMRMSHMMADGDAELVAFARRLGLRSGWLQRSGPCDPPHFDISMAVRGRAVALGACEVSMRDMVSIRRRQRAFRG